MIDWDAAKKKAEAIDARRTAKSSAGVVTSSGTYNTPANPLLSSVKSAQPKENPIIKALSRLGESSDTTLPAAAVKQSKESGYSKAGTLGGRLRNIFAGGLKSSAADYVSAGGGVLAAKGGTEMTPIYNEQISESMRDLEANRTLLAREDLSDTERAEIQDQIKIIENRLNTYTKAYDANKETGAKLLDESSKTAQSAQENISAAKRGLGKVGSALVDVGVAGVQMGTDAAASLLTGGTVTPLSVTSARVFGSAAKAAIDNGATYEQAVNRGALAAITTYGISKLLSTSSLAKKFAGQGASDTFATTVINKLADKLGKTAAGKAFIAQTGKLLVSGAGEDIEEMLEDAIAPVLDAVTYQGASGLNQYADADYYADMLYDGLIGGIIGSLGGAADVAASIGKTAVKGADANAQTPAQSTALNNTPANTLNISQESAQALQNGFKGDGGDVVSGLESMNTEPSARETGDTASQAKPVNAMQNSEENLPKGTGAASLGFDPYTQALNRFGAIPDGENPARMVDVPQQTADNNRVSRGVRTALEAQATTDEAYGDIMDAVIEGKFSHIPITDKSAVVAAEQTIKNKGWENAIKDWTADARSGKVSKNLIVLGQTLYNNAINAGQTKAGVDILVDLVKMSRSGAQATQANRVLKQLSPQYQLYALQGSVERLNAEFSEKLSKKGFENININSELAQAYLDAKTDTERDAAMEALKDDIARQLPSSWYDKWNAWRYLSMLGNPRTHIRNIIGNAGFAPVRMIKNAIGAGIEKVVNPQQRTKAMLSLKDKPLKELARADYDAVSDEVLGNGKFNDTIGDIERRKPIFNTKFLESARKHNNEALEVEDSWFSKPAYVNSLAGWYKANGITAEMLEGGKVSQDIIDKARAYAIREAQRATYRDSNNFSDFVARLGRNYTGNNAAAKAANVLVEGVLPFKRTPANILARAVEYSPVGLAKGLTYDLAKVKSGEMEAWQAIDDISAGLTGTAIVGLGMLLASRELVTGGASDDDDERALDTLEGKQNYALNIGNKSYTIDWLAPEALPFFVGVELYNELSSENDEASVWDFIDKLSNISEPMFEMSMLQGVNDLIDSVKYSDGNSIAGVFGSAAVNYASQGLPTLLGQLERTLEPERKTTYIDKTSDVPAETQYMLGKLSGKIPGWEYQQIPYKDALGRTESNGSVGKRIVNNFFNPSYVKSSAANDLTEELRRLNDANALESVPTKPDTYFKYDGERHDLSGEDYSQFQSTRGKTASKIFTEVLQSGYYKKQMDDARRSQLVAEIFGFANDVAKKEYIGRGYESSKYEKVYEAQKEGIDPADYFIYKDIEKQIDNNNSLSQFENAKAVNSVPGLSIAQKGALWTINNGKESDKNPFTGALPQMGFAPARCIEIMEARSVYGKKTEFVGWLSGQGYSQNQIDAIWKVYK